MSQTHYKDAEDSCFESVDDLPQDISGFSTEKDIMTFDEKLLKRKESSLMASGNSRGYRCPKHLYRTQGSKDRNQLQEKSLTEAFDGMHICGNTSEASVGKLSRDIFLDSPEQYEPFAKKVKDDSPMEKIAKQFERLITFNSTNTSEDLKQSASNPRKSYG